MPPNMDQQITHSRVVLSSKPSAALATSHTSARGDTGIADILIVFLNGLILPRAPWIPVMAAILRRFADVDALPQMLAYDRFGQGDSDPDPLDDEPGKEPGYGHTVPDVVEDLHQLIRQTIAASYGARRRVVFVASSIGCALARLYTQQYPESVAGVILLDSMMANQNFIDMFPDPSAPGFDPSTLPHGITPEIMMDQRRRFRERFAPDVKNGEKLDRRNLRHLLPHSDLPMLRGYSGKSPFLTVVGHDKDYFAKLSLEGDMKTPIAITANYLQPAWDRYNEGLLQIAEVNRVEGIIIAKNCGHFIPADDPDFVAEMVVNMLQKLSIESSS
jgi:pimeloyl-ACP methyl ester carboxylesterase